MNRRHQSILDMPGDVIWNEVAAYQPIATTTPTPKFHQNPNTPMVLEYVIIRGFINHISHLKFLTPPPERAFRSGLQGAFRIPPLYYIPINLNIPEARSPSVGESALLVEWV